MTTRSIDRGVKDGQFGLMAWLEEQRVRLPLKGVECSFEVRGGVAVVDVDQIFHQSNRRPLNCNYLFPLPAGAAVHRCEVRINDRRIVARVESREAAAQLVLQHMAAGRRTLLVEAERENLFTLSLGNVQPGDVVVVRLSYVQPVSRWERRCSLEIPLCPGERYIPGRPLLRSNQGSGTVDDTDVVPDASRITPPRIDALHPDAAYVALEGILDGGEAVRGSVSSPTHPVAWREAGAEVAIELVPDGHVPDRAVKIEWLCPRSMGLGLQGWLTRKGGYDYALLALRAPPRKGRQASPVDLYFLVDRSGSMEGVKWQGAVRALLACVQRIGPEDRVMVTLFESEFRDFAERPLTATALRADARFRGLEKLGAEGGTEMAPALKHVLELVSRHSADRDAALILITDGQIGNDEEIVRLAAGCPRLVIHCFGIDVALNDSLLGRLSRDHGGTCHAVQPEEDTEVRVAEVAEALRHPVLTSATVHGGWELAAEWLPPVYAGQVVHVAMRRPTGEGGLTLVGQGADGRAVALPVTLMPVEFPAPRLLWCRERIARLLESGRTEDAVALSRSSNLICTATAFVAWDEREQVAVASETLVQPALETATVDLTFGLTQPIASMTSDLGRSLNSYLCARPSAPAQPFVRLGHVRVARARARTTGDAREEWQTLKALRVEAVGWGIEVPEGLRQIRDVPPCCWPASAGTKPAAALLKQWRARLASIGRLMTTLRPILGAAEGQPGRAGCLAAQRRRVKQRALAREFERLWQLTERLREQAKAQLAS